MAKELVTIAKYDDSMLATLAKQCLDDAGIPAVIVGEAAATMIPYAAAIEVQVEKDFVQEAMQILEAFDETQSKAGDEDLDEDEEELEQEP